MLPLTQKEMWADQAGCKNPSHWSLPHAGELQSWALFSRSKKTRMGTVLAPSPSCISGGTPKRGGNMKNRTRSKAVQIYMWPKRGWESLIWLLIVIVLWKIQISSQSSTDTEIWSDKSWVINFFHQKQGAASQLSTSSCQLWVDEAVIWCEGWQGRGMSVQWVRHRGSAPAFGVVPWRGMGEVGGQELEKIIKCLHCFI